MKGIAVIVVILLIELHVGLLSSFFCNVLEFSESLSHEALSQ